MAFRMTLSPGEVYARRHYHRIPMTNPGQEGGEETHEEGNQGLPPLEPNILSTSQPIDLDRDSLATGAALLWWEHKHGSQTLTGPRALIPPQGLPSAKPWPEVCEYLHAGNLLQTCQSGSQCLHSRRGVPGSCEPDLVFYPWAVIDPRT